MVNLLNNELKVKLDCFKNLHSDGIIPRHGREHGALSVEQFSVINYHTLVSRNVCGLASHASLTGRPMVSMGEYSQAIFLKAFLNLPPTKSARGLILSSCSRGRICGFESKSEVPSNGIS